MLRRCLIGLICSWSSLSFAQGSIFKLKVDGAINPVTSEYLIGGIESAENAGAEAVLIVLSTPGGLVFSMSAIMEKMLASEVPTIVYVSPSGTHAASAGFFILLSADIAAMAPSTRTGSAHPILSVGGVPVGDNETVKTLLEKITNDSVASLRSIVKRRGRNVEMAEAGVRQSKSFTEEQALEGNLIDLIAHTESELLEKLDGRELTLFSKKRVVLKTRGVTVETIEMTARQQLLAALSNPNLALLLGVGGILLLFFEFSNPGMIAPGVIGGICLLLSMLGFSFLPINYVGVLLIVLAIGLFIAEIKVQGFGILGLGGSVSMVFGILTLIKAPDPEVKISIGTALGIGLSFTLAFLLLLYLFLRSTHYKVATGQEGLLGLQGRAITELSPAGKVFIHGEYWEAVADEKIEAGDLVAVSEVDDLRLRVKKLSRDEPRGSGGK